MIFEEFEGFWALDLDPVFLGFCGRGTKHVREF
jgi:hypothetical protein